MLPARMYNGEMPRNPRLLLAAAVVIACTPAVATPAAATPAAAVSDSTYVGGVPLVVGPAESVTAACGLARDYKIGGRVDPLVANGDGSWTVSGCFYSHGNELRNTEIVLTFPRDGADAQDLYVLPIRELVAPDHREVTFTKTIRRTSGSGLRAYLAMSVRPGP
jgi:hypothetical protein